MTKEELKELGVPEEHLDAVWQAHQAETDALRQEQLHARRQQALHTALRGMGAEESAAGLLALAVKEEDIVLDASGGLENPQTLLAPLKERFAVLFSVPEQVPAGEIHPPRSGYAPAMPDISRMTEEEINRNWDSVRDALGRMA